MKRSALLLVRRVCAEHRTLRATIVLLALLLWGCGGAPMAPEAPGAYDGAARADAPQAEMVAPSEMSAPAPGDMMDSDMMAGGSPGAAPSPAPPPRLRAPGAARPAPPAAQAGAPSPAKGPDRAGSSHAKEGATLASKRPATTVAQMLIYTAQIRTQVLQKSFPQTIDRVVDLAVSKGGYLTKHDNATVQVRVPSARFRDALKEIEALGKVTHRAVQAQDVTEEYHDLTVRLKSLHATRDRLEQFLGRAKNIQEVLSIEKELGRLNTEIDRVEGRIRFLSSRAAFSTITVALEAKPEPVIAKDPNGDPPPPPPPNTLELPIEWLSQVGLERLLNLR